MGKILGFGAVLAAAYLTGTLGAAFGQERGGTTAPNTIANQAISTTVKGATGTSNQPGGSGANAAAPTNIQVPGTAGSTLNQAGVTGTATTPGTAATPGQATGIGAGTGAPSDRVPGTAGTVLNQTRVTGTTRNTTAPGTVNAGTAYAPRGATYSTYPTTVGAPGVMQGTYPANVTAATPGWVGRTMPGMTGYNSVNPMGTTMAPGYYYAGTAGMPYIAYNNTPGYVYPRYGGPGYGYGDPYSGYGNGYGYGYPYYSNYAAPGVGVSYTSAYVAPAGSAANTVMPAQGRNLGIDQDPVVDSSGRWGMMVTNVYPGSPAQRAGLRVGDVISSINGYRNEKRNDLDRIIANAAPNNQLNMTVNRSIDGQQRAITAQLP